MATQNLGASTLFDEFEVIVDKNTDEDILSIKVFDEIETELRHLFDEETNDIEFTDDTDRPIDFLKEVVQKFKTEFDGILEDPNKKKLSGFLLKYLQDF